MESRLGEGSVFTVELELHIQERADDPQFWKDHGARRILAADDEKAAYRTACNGQGAFVDDVRNAIESGMDAHIAKPVQADTLKSTIRQVLDSRLPENAGKA